MRPTPIPDDEAFGHRIVVAAPDGDLLNPDIAAVEAIVADDGFFVRIALDDGDLERLAAGAPIWLHFHSDRMPVWSIGVAS